MGVRWVLWVFLLIDSFNPESPDNARLWLDSRCGVLVLSAGVAERDADLATEVTSSAPSIVATSTGVVTIQTQPTVTVQPAVGSDRADRPSSSSFPDDARDEAVVPGDDVLTTASLSGHAGRSCLWQSAHRIRYREYVM